jgi:YYY domain-containing protein
MIAETFAWWLVIVAIGFVALPIALVLFRRLPGAGYAFAKPLGLLLTGYLFWLALTVHLLPNRPGSIVWVLLALVVVDFFILRRRGAEFRNILESRLGLILAVEVVFLLALFIGAHIRSYVPEISGTEKPMDFMFLNALDRNRFYPPDDPWLAGFDVSYYYFGYLIQAMVSNLAAVKTSVAFNLGLTSTAALAATAAFGLGYDLAMLLRRVALRTAIGVGVTAAVFVALLGNLEGVIEFGVANGALNASAVDSVDIGNLESAEESDSCLVPVVCIKYPTEDSSFWWWWRATRISPEANSITEFPFFSFILGDLHPHVMAIPYLLTVFALALAFWRSESPLSLDTWRDRPLLLLLSAVLVGGLGFLNSWDLPTMGFLVALLVLVRNLAGRDWRQGIEDTLGFVAPLGVLAVVFYAPFYMGFGSQVQGFTAVGDEATRPLHSLLFWGPLFAVALPLPLLRVAADASSRTLRRIGYCVAPLIGLLVLWALLLAIDGRSISDAVTERGWNWVTALFFAGTFVVSVLALWRSVESTDEDDFALSPALAATSVALLLVLGAELFFVRDVFGTRLNSVFKLYYQAWLLLAVSGALSAWWLLRQVYLPSTGLQMARGAAVGLAALLIAGGLLYPLGATLSRTGGLGNEPRTLDGLRASAVSDPDEYQATEYLRRIAGLNDRLIEASGDPYSSAGRFAARTGIPTVLGWDGHEVQWGRDRTLLAQRRADVDRVYETLSLEEALSILRQYDVTYVVVGSVERAKYASEALQKFDAGLMPVFRSGDTVIYRTPVDEPDTVTR